MCELCHHVMPSGARCQSPALRGKPFCYFHSRQRRITSQNRNRSISVLLPVVEDSSSLLLATNELLAALADSRINPGLAATLLRVLDLARKTIHSKQPSAAKDAVTALSTTEAGDVVAADSATQTEDGDSPSGTFPDALFDSHNTRECLLSPQRDDAYYMGMHKAELARSKMRNTLMHFEPSRSVSDPLPGDPDEHTWSNWERRQEELKKLREQREEIR